MKRKQDQIAGHRPWEIEEAYYINHRGINPENAHTFTILRWMYLGDFRPLAAAIDEDHPLDKAVLNVLAQFIDEGRLKLIPKKGPGRLKAPETFARRVAANLAYDHRLQSGEMSKEAFEDIANALGTSEQTVRRDVTAWRNSQRNMKQ